MGITRNPVFKSVMFALAVLYITLLSQPGMAAKPVKPPPEPVIAEDVDCNGCVDTVDIADGAVGTSELSADIQSQLATYGAKIIALQEEVDVLKQSVPTPHAVDGDGNVIGKVVGLTMRESHVNTSSDYVQANGFRVKVLTDEGYTTMLNASDGTVMTNIPPSVYYAQQACMGAGYAPYAIPGTVYKVGNELDSANVWMSPIDAQTAEERGDAGLQVLSYSGGTGVCGGAKFAIIPSDWREAYPNDPAITGINTQTATDAYSAPITIR